MKKRLSALVCAVCLLALLCVPVQGRSLGVSLSTVTSARAGDSITVSVSVTGNGLQALQGELVYDASQLTIKGHGNKLAGWELDIDTATAGNVTFLGIDAALQAPINGTKRLFTLTFQLNSALKEEETVTLTARDCKASDGESDFNAANASAALTVAAHLSDEARLSTLTITNAGLFPAFSPDVFSYTATVPNAITQLHINAITTDSAARVTLGSNKLKVGQNTVRLTVTAASGKQKVYTIMVTRAAAEGGAVTAKESSTQPSVSTATVQAADAPSALLAAIFATQGTLSPAFDPLQFAYILYVPFETQEIVLQGATQEEAAVCTVTGPAELAVGGNAFVLTVTASDKTVQQYTVDVQRMPRYTPGQGVLGEAVEFVSSQQEQDDSVPLWIWLVICLTTAAIGFGIGTLLIQRKTNRPKR